MSHLGSRVAALVDGELAPDVAARAHAHAAACPPCLRALEAERQTRALLVGAAEPPVPAGLTAALLAMGGPSGPLPPRTGHLPGAPRPRTLGFAEPAAVGPLHLSRRSEPLASGPPSGRPDAGPGRTRVRRVVHRVRGRADRGPGATLAAVSGPGTGPLGARTGTGPGRLVRSRLAVVVAGSVSLASVGLLSLASLSAVLDDGGAPAVTTRLTVERDAGTGPTILPASRSGRTSTAAPSPAPSGGPAGAATAEPQLPGATPTTGPSPAPTTLAATARSQQLAGAIRP